MVAASELSPLFESSRTERWAAGDILLQLGDTSDYVLWIRHGQVKVWTVSARGTEAVLGIRGAGELIGEFAAIDGQPRWAMVTALGPVRGSVVSSATFQNYLRARPSAAFELLTRVVARVREADQHRIDFSSYDVGERVARVLLELADNFGSADGRTTRIDVPLSQAEIAGVTSASREAVARALRELRESGTLATDRRRITVLSRELLKQYADR